jgi:hypothetical protein
MDSEPVPLIIERKMTDSFDTDGGQTVLSFQSR